MAKDRPEHVRNRNTGSKPVMFNEKNKHMTEMKPNKVGEEQVTGLTGRDVQAVDTRPLTVKNAHRAAMIRKKGSTDTPVPFHFRKKHHGMANFVHLLGSPEEGKELRPAEFKDWEVTEFKHPGYLEDLWEQACDAYRWSSFDPDIRGESDIMIYEKELHDDLKKMPEEKYEGYITAYKQRFAAQLAALSRCANSMVTGRAGFDVYRQEKADRAYQSRYEDLRNWRSKVLKAVERTKDENRPEEEKQEQAWLSLKRDIESSANTIHELDTGKCKGYNRALFVSSILNKVSTCAGHGEVEIVQRAVDFISEYNAKVKKPIITARNKFFSLPETARKVREKLAIVKEQENRELPFEGGLLVWNYGEDRLQILFDRIPEDAKRKELKSSGFRWSPKNKTWQRQLTPNALSAAKRVLNLQNI